MREEWRRHSVLTALGGMRVVGKGFDGYREALAAPGGGRPMTRLGRLGAALGDAVARHRRRQCPLPDRIRELELRAARRAGRRRRRSTPISGTARRRVPIEGVEFVQTRAGRRGRARRAARGEANRIRGVAYLASPSGRRSAPAAWSSCATRGLVESPAGCQGRRPSSDAIGGRRRSRTPSTRRSRRSGSWAARRPSWPGGSSVRSVRAVPRGSPSGRSSRRGKTVRGRMRTWATRSSRPGRS